MEQMGLMGLIQGKQVRHILMGLNNNHVYDIKGGEIRSGTY